MEGVRVSTKGLFDQHLRQEIVVPAGQTVAEVTATLQLDSSTGLAVLVNGRLVTQDDMVMSGDEMVLVEMISGG